MFATDSLGELNFVLEFNLPKEISDNKEHIKLSVHHVNIPIVNFPVYRATPGEINCIEYCGHIKDKLHLLEKWSRAIYDKPFGWANSDLYIDAKLYGYKDDKLVTFWSLRELYPTLFPTIKYENQVELQFGFVDAGTFAPDNDLHS